MSIIRGTMKRVLIVILSLYNGGAEKSLVNLLNEMAEDRYEVDLLLVKPEGVFLSQVPQWVKLLDTPEKMLTLYSSAYKKSGNRWTRLKRYYSTLLSRIVCKTRQESQAFRWKYFYKKSIPMLEKEYDMAVAYGSEDAMYVVSDKVKAKKKALWVHNDYRAAGFPKKYDIEHYEKMDAIVSISDKCVEILKEEFPNLADRMQMIPNITSSIVINKRAGEFFPPEFENKENVILSIGRLCEQKGFDIAIQAAEILKQRKVPFDWYIIGNGVDEGMLTEMITKGGLEEQFHLIGTRDNPYPYIGNCAVFAQTSRFEGKSIVLDEAKILAKPILVTKYPTVHDQIEAGKEGMIVALEPAAIADGLEELLTKQTSRDALVNYLSAREYGNQDIIEKYYNVLDM